MTVVVLLTIDGLRVPISRIWIHAQEIPRPGGSSFELLIPCATATQFGARLGLDLGVDQVFDPELSWKGLEQLDRLLFEERLGDTCAEEFVLQRFVMNTIDSTRPSDSGTVIFGRCSPFLPTFPPD